MTLLEFVASTLDGWGIPHAVIGAGALAAAGVARSTFDIDLMVTDRAVLRADRWDLSAWPRVTLDVRTGDDDDPLAGVVRFDSADERPVDLIVGRHPWQARAIARAAHSPGSTPVVVPRDLVLLKLYAGGTQDLWDIRELLRTSLDAATLVREIEEDLRTLPTAMQEAWAHARGAG